MAEAGGNRASELRRFAGKGPDTQAHLFRPQGGLLSGKDPTQFNPADPIRLWIIQVGEFAATPETVPVMWDLNLIAYLGLGIIILTSQLLSLGLAKIRQPKVIAEVLGMRYHFPCRHSP